MSRIGKNPVVIPAGVTVEVNNNVVSLKNMATGEEKEIELSADNIIAAIK